MRLKTAIRAAMALTPLALSSCGAWIATTGSGAFYDPTLDYFYGTIPPPGNPWGWGNPGPQLPPPQQQPPQQPPTNNAPPQFPIPEQPPGSGLRPGASGGNQGNVPVPSAPPQRIPGRH